MTKKEIVKILKCNNDEFIYFNTEDIVYETYKNDIVVYCIDKNYINIGSDYYTLFNDFIYYELESRGIRYNDVEDILDRKILEDRFNETYICINLKDYNDDEDINIELIEVE